MESSARIKQNSESNQTINTILVMDMENNQCICLALACKKKNKYVIILVKFLKLIQNGSKQKKKLKTFCSSSFEFQTRKYVTCFGYICNHPHGQENYTQKYINMVLITV